MSHHFENIASTPFINSFFLYIFLLNILSSFSWNRSYHYMVTIINKQLHTPNEKYGSEKRQLLHWYNNKQEMPSLQQKSAKKGPQKYLISRPNPVSIIFKIDVTLSGKRPSVFFTGKLRLATSWRNIIVTESVKIKKSRGSWKILETEFKFSKISLVRSNALYVYVSPNQQHGWPLRPHHTLCVTN